MKNLLLLLLLCISTYLMGIAQNYDLRDTIQVYYNTGKVGGAIGGQNHCVTIWNNMDGIIFCQRKCYGILSDEEQKLGNGILNHIDTTFTQELYQITQEKAILHFYNNNNNFIILDTLVKIDQSQFEQFIRIIDEIITFGEVNDARCSEELIVSTKRNHYMIKKNNNISIIIDWFGRYDRSRDIEKSLGLKRYSRCPCIIKDLNNIPNREFPRSRAILSRGLLRNKKR